MNVVKVYNLSSYAITDGCALPDTLDIVGRTHKDKQPFTLGQSG